jgi:hypothetical protein
VSARIVDMATIRRPAEDTLLIPFDRRGFNRRGQANGAADAAFDQSQRAVAAAGDESAVGSNLDITA